MMHDIPSWMQESENYTAETDRDGFVTKSLLSIAAVLSGFRRNEGAGEKPYVFLAAMQPSVPVKIILALLVIILTSCSRNLFFTCCMIGALLVHLCFLENYALRNVFMASLGAAAFSGLLLLPAVFLGSPHTLLSVSLKVFLSVGLLGFLAATTPWNRITAGLRFFRVPDLFIFTFDITLKYIVILGDTCVAMLQALRLRSVGRNRSKSRALSGILGVAFLKSRHMAEEMCEAMACRGFTGEYTRRKGLRYSHDDRLQAADLIYLAVMVGVAGLFWYL